MVGHKLGEFSPTRKFAGHTPADKKAAAEGGTAKTPSAASAPKAAVAAPGAAPKAPASSTPKGKDDGKK